MQVKRQRASKTHRYLTGQTGGQRTNPLPAYEFIKRYIAEHGRAPAQRDIMKGLGRSKAAVVRYLGLLERYALITREPGVDRSIRLTAQHEAIAANVAARLAGIKPNSEADLRRRFNEANQQQERIQAQIAHLLREEQFWVNRRVEARRGLNHLGVIDYE